MTLEDLKAGVADLQTKVSAENTELGQVVTGLQDAATKIDQLKAQIASGVNVTEADLEDLTSSLSTVASGAAAATSAAQTAEPDPSNPQGAPAAPAPAEAESVPAEDAVAGSDSGPAVVPPQGGGERTVYVHQGAGPVDGMTWQLAPVHTADGQELYYFAGDSAPGDRSGEGIAGEWHVYDGPVAQADVSGAVAGGVQGPESTDEGAVPQQEGESLPPEAAQPGSSPSQLGGAQIAAEQQVGAPNPIPPAGDGTAEQARDEAPSDGER